ncbi:CII family transcriptional regulator [Rosenbergiella epipactidis]|uniref:CII family transcriptional regulator n=1 Tax=Rosenbergiella epipactidis TaxID=1544694 RepID=UPI001F503E9F|nr:CII family transcriptional regulator [Rosenbergiella epipactidis]
MDFAIERKKALQIETFILSKITERGQSMLAKFLGLNESSISRLKAATGKQKYSVMQLTSLILAFAGMDTPEFDLPGSIGRLEKRLEKMEELLAKKKPGGNRASSQLAFEL